MSDKAIFLMVLMLSLFLIPSHARTECVEQLVLTGCTSAGDFNCDGQISNSQTDSLGIVTATCTLLTASYCPIGECSSGDTPNRNGCESTFNVFGSDTGKLAEAESFQLCRSLCPYGWYEFCTPSHTCIDWAFFGLWCNEYETYVTSTCTTPYCETLGGTSTVSCTKTSEILTDCSNIPVGSCTQSGTFCYQGGVTECNDDTNQANMLINCEESGTTCFEKTPTFAVCLSDSERDASASCSPEGNFRCNPSDTTLVDKCIQEVWQNTGQLCSLGCNYTGVNSGNQCNDFNTATGRCTFGETVCVDAGTDAFLFACAVGDFQLIKECENDRCGTNNTACWDQCEFLDTLCYAENYTCYYCNELGDLTLSGQCMGIVNNVTRECTLQEECTENAYTCDGSWAIKCVGGEWRRVEQCSYGCSLGRCVSTGGDIFEPIMEWADISVLFLPALGGLIAFISVGGFIYFGLKAFGRYIGKGGDVTSGKR